MFGGVLIVFVEELFSNVSLLKLGILRMGSITSVAIVNAGAVKKS
jgi:hypothetical protein